MMMVYELADISLSIKNPNNYFDIFSYVDLNLTMV